jgi:hypothetical protein
MTPILRRTLTALSIPVFFIACKKNGNSSGSCSEAMCTADFRTVSVYLTDGSGPARTIDSIRVLGPDGQPTLGGGAIDPPLGYYPVAGDEWVLKHPKATLPFRFKAFSRGQTIVDTPYRIGTDCCHVYKISGPDTIRIR